MRSPRAEIRERPSRFLLLLAAVSAAVSQAGWWGAMVIGFINH